MTHKFILTVTVTVETNLNAEDALAEFQAETEYLFQSTEGCRVTDQELIEGEIAIS